jgi:hypothetical protein
VSRVDLDANDRRTVEHARRLLAEIAPASRPDDEAAAAAWQADRMGKALAAIDFLLRVIDGGEQR